MSEMLHLIQVTSDEQITAIRQLYLEYLEWLIEKINQEYGLIFDVNKLLDDFMESVNVFYPPQGRIQLAKFGDEFAGVGCLKRLSDDIGEIKRMFVRDAYRRKGVGKVILDQLIADASSIGYSRIRLDSPKISTMAHGLYLSRGFRYIDKYEGSEAAKSIPDFAVYMELDL